MDSQASIEKRFVSTIEKVVMYVMYAVFGVINGAIILSGDYEALFVMVPITVFSLGVTKWGIKWQNERYVRSAENQDDIGDLKNTIKDLEKRIIELEKK
jgi:hypothetical protein|tara:strand:+ start:289 stop:585 length:297 start_codon:yes stop_codon:yes gene_type:complete